MADFTDEDDALLSELGVEIEQKKTINRTPREARIIAGFEEVQRFVVEHGRIPTFGDGKNIFEKIYATRLDQLRTVDECRDLLASLDYQGLLGNRVETSNAVAEELDDDALLEELGIEESKAPVTELRHVRPMAKKKAAEDVANREKCKDFENFKPTFEQVKQELKLGVRISRLFKDDARIEKGNLFILKGQMAYVAQVGEEFVADYGRPDRRLRVIFDNGTEIQMLKRSLERALQKDEAGRRITEADAGPLFGDQIDDADEPTGTIYVLRSNSDHPIVQQNRQLVHKIGVTSGNVKARIANAVLDPTFMMADVEVVTTYRLFNLSPMIFERIIHRVFADVRFEIQIPDRFNNIVEPKEWFLVPLEAIDSAIKLIQSGDISKFRYNPKIGELVSDGR